MNEITLDAIFDVAQSIFPADLKTGIFDGSSVARAEIRQLLYLLRPKMTVEIGTFHGFTTAVLASKSERCWTFDIGRNRYRHAVWDALGVRDKIREFISHPKIRIECMKHIATRATHRAMRESRGLIRRELKDEEIDMVFLDGLHSYEETKANFECVSHSRSVVFDGSRLPFYGVMRFVREIGGIQFGPLGVYVQ